MELVKDWETIKQHFSRSFGSSLHVSIASVDNDNFPTVTPIGSLFLNNDQSGFYFEKFPKNLPKHSEINNKVCVLAVNSSKWYWVRSLFYNRFKSYPAIKLYGILGEKRPATEIELHALKRRMRMTKRLKGHQFLWDNMGFVRDIQFSKVSAVKFGEMMSNIK